MAKLPEASSIKAEKRVGRFTRIDGSLNNNPSYSRILIGSRL